MDRDQQYLSVAGGMSPVLELLCMGPTCPERDLRLKHAGNMESCAYVYGVELGTRELQRQGHSPFWTKGGPVTQPCKNQCKYQEEPRSLLPCFLYEMVL